MVSKLYKGRITFDKLIELPLGTVHYLYYIMLQKTLTDEGRKELEGEAMAEAMTGGMI